MSWKLDNIPKTLFLYWGKNKPLSYLRYLTVKSFSALNHDWDINIYYPNCPTLGNSWKTDEQKYTEDDRDYFPELENIPRVSVLPVEFFVSNNLNSVSEVFKSDILRLYLLSKIGGWWSDFDILYIKPMNSMSINTEENGNAMGAICYQDGFNSIGFLAGAKGFRFFEVLLEQCSKEFNANNYQSIGRFLFDKNVELISSYLINMPSNLVYPISWDKCSELFSSNVDIGNDSIGIHWFAGAKNTIEKGSVLDRYIKVIEGM